MNRLTTETSPYLLQHAENPVHWYPWGEAALRAASDHNKPILLSIGYSACHWCHVMAHESFENPEIASLMNRLYINVKVDREERPDLDRIYQGAHSMLTGRPGGWPLTVFLSPEDRMPIFAGTYFPPEPRHGLPSFPQLLEGVADAWQSRRDDIDQQSHSLRDAFRRLSLPAADPDVQLNGLPLDIARSQIMDQFDSRYGGFSSAPKFPHPAILQRAIGYWAGGRPERDSRVLHAALHTLRQMCDGGIFDHLGGGFYRYSTDEKWEIPHFEKMLYDNGPLLALNATAGLITGDPVHIDAATETADWVMREMQHPDGGYYSSLDADSDGGEGRFYVWTDAEIARHLQDDELALFSHRFGLDRPANFEGRWHLHVNEPYENLAKACDSSAESVRQRLTRLRRKLFAVREQRTHPARDEKILTAWNGLMIQGMASAGRLLRNEAYIDSAARAARFVHATLWRDGRLLATCKDGRAHLNAYLDDYAFMLAALLELLQSCWDTRLLEWAIALADGIITHFEDTEQGGYYFTSHDHEQLITRSKSFSDDAIPAGCGVAASSLQRLGFLLAEPRYLESAERCIRAAWPAMKQAAISHCSMLEALQQYLDPPQIIVLRGSRDGLDQWLDAVRGHYLHATSVYAISSATDLPVALSGKPAAKGTVAYVCRGVQCLPPVESFARWQEIVNSEECRLADT